MAGSQRAARQQANGCSGEQRTPSPHVCRGQRAGHNGPGLGQVAGQSPKLRCSSAHPLQGPSRPADSSGYVVFFVAALLLPAGYSCRKQGSPLAHRGSAREAGAVPCLVQQRHSPVAMTARKCFRMPSELFPPVHAAPCICVGLPLRMARRSGVNGCGLRRAAALVKREDLPGAPSLLRGWACRVAEGDEAFTFLFRKAPT